MVTIATFFIGWQRLREYIHALWIQDRWVVFLFVAAIVCNVIAYGLCLWQLTPTDDSMVLHYSVYFGIDLVGPWYQIYSLPLIGTFLWLLNGTLLVPLHRRDALFGYAIAGTTLVCDLLLGITTALLLWVNG